MSLSYGTYAWRKQGNLAVGEHRVSHPLDPTGRALLIEVLPYGQEAGFDPASIINVRYRLRQETVWTPMMGMGTAESVVDGVWLEVLEVSSDQGSLPMQDLFLHGGFLGDGSALSVEGRVVVDTAAVSLHNSQLGQLDGYCNVASNLGQDCFDCRGNGEYCPDMRLHGGVLEIDTDPPDTELVACGVDLTVEDEEPLSCTFPDTSCSASFVGLLGLTGLLRPPTTWRQLNFKEQKPT